MQNWPLANYELEQIRASDPDTQRRLFANNDEVKDIRDAMTPAADDLGRAIKAKDAAEVREGVEQADRRLQHLS